MPKQDIEAELRGEIKPQDFPRIKRELTKRGFKLEKKYRRIRTGSRSTTLLCPILERRD